MILFMETEHLILRSWQQQDRKPFQELNADPKVNRFFPWNTMEQKESDQLVDKIQSHFDKHGFGFFACEHKKDQKFIGFVGLSIPVFKADFTPCVEIGWRLAKEYWNMGLATEGAKQALVYAKEILQLNEVVSFTVPHNLASRRVMEKIGMYYVKDFDHSSLPKNHELLRHVLYKIVF